MNARAVFCWLAVREPGYSGAEVARLLGVAPSRVTRVVSGAEDKEISLKSYARCARCPPCTSRDREVSSFPSGGI